jgi:hypothetical protein
MECLFRVTTGNTLIEHKLSLHSSREGHPDPGKPQLIKTERSAGYMFATNLEMV